MKQNILLLLLCSISIYAMDNRSENEDELEQLLENTGSISEHSEPHTRGFSFSKSSRTASRNATPDLNQEEKWPECRSATYDDVINHLNGLKRYMLFTAKEGGREVAQQAEQIITLLEQQFKELEKTNKSLELPDTEESFSHLLSQQHAQQCAALSDLKALILKLDCIAPLTELQNISRQIGTLETNTTQQNVEIKNHLVALMHTIKNKNDVHEKTVQEYMIQWERFKMFAYTSIGSIFIMIAWYLSHNHDCTDINSNVQEAI